MRHAQTALPTDRGTDLSGGRAAGAPPAAGLLRLQEIVTFDPAEGPKRYTVHEHEARVRAAAHA